MTKSYDKNLQIINNLDVQLNIFKYKELKTSVLQNFVKDFSQMNGISYNDDDIDAVCEALEFMDVTIVDDSDEIIVEHPASTDTGSGISADESGETNDSGPEPSNGSETEYKIEGSGISYSDIEIQLNEMLHPKKPDFSELARAASSADLCRLIIDNPENYIKVMYAIRKQL